MAGRSRRIPIIVNADEVGSRSPANTFTQVQAEVDRHSRIAVEFDRDWITSRMTGTGTEIIVRGRVEGEGNNRNIEVRNYTLVGKESQPTAVRVRSAAEVGPLVAGSLTSWKVAREEIEGLRRDITVAQTAAAQDLERKRADLRIAEGNYALSIRQIALDSAAALVYLTGAPEAAPTDAEPPIVKQLRASRDAAAEAAAAVQRLEREEASAARKLIQTQSSYGFRVAARPHVPRIREAMLERRQILEIPLETLTNPQDRVLVSVAARAAGENPELLVRLANSVRTVWFPRLEQSQSRPDASDPKRDTVQTDRDFDAIVQISSALQSIGTVMDTLKNKLDQRPATLTGELVGYLKDTDIDIAETGARVGDVVVLTVTNGESDPALRRDLVIRMKVRDFGFTPKISESFLLVHRLGVDDLDNQRTLAAARTHVGNVQRDTIVRLQSEVRFTPAPSFNFGWTWNQRRCGWDCTGWQRAATAVHWLRPSFGLNVAVPSFGTQRVSVTPGTNGGAPTEKIEEIDRGLDLGVGGVVGLFDNTIVLGYGRHLTAESPRNYFALGFSFVKIVQGVVQTASQ
jgi:hypothetical protein